MEFDDRLVLLRYPKYYDILCTTGEAYIISFSKMKPFGGFIAQKVDKDGYIRVWLNSREIFLHKVIAEVCFGKRPVGMQIDHIDGNKQNNHPSNLEYVSPRENIQRIFKAGRHPAYKDGRCADKKKYQHDWYIRNRERILTKKRGDI